MAKKEIRSGNFGGMGNTSLSQKLKDKAHQTTQSDLEKIKKEKSVKTTENKKESEPVEDNKGVGEQPKAAAPAPIDDSKTEVVTPLDETKVVEAPVQTTTPDESKEVEKEATSISLDKDVLMKMKVYCKANKISLSGEINKYLKNQYIPKKKVNEFLKNMFG